MEGLSIKILNLCPDLLNISGDTGNVKVLKKRCSDRGITAICSDFVSGDDFNTDGADIILIGGGGEKETIAGVDVLMPYAEKLKEFAENGGVILACHTGYQMLLKTFEMSKKTYSGLGILDANSIEADKNYMGDFAIKADIDGKEIILAGFENHKNITKTKLAPLGRVFLGTGDRGENEGVFYKNTIATYMCGPILPKNPELADFLIKKALENKYSDFNGELKELCDDFEQEAKQFIINRNKR